MDSETFLDYQLDCFIPHTSETNAYYFGADSKQLITFNHDEIPTFDLVDNDLVLAGPFDFKTHQVINIRICIRGFLQVSVVVRNLSLALLLCSLFSFRLDARVVSFWNTNC